MAMNQKNNNKSFMSDINVTPLVDVMLVLLIIFMVTAPMLMQGVEVNLPKTTTKHIKTQDEPLILTVNKEREIFIENHRIKLESLEIKVEKIFQNRRDKEILLRADEEVPYGFVMKVIAKVKQAGLDKVGLVTEPLD